MQNQSVRRFLIFITFAFLIVLAYQEVKHFAASELFDYFLNQTASVKSVSISINNGIVLHAVRLYKHNNCFLSIGKLKIGHRELWNTITCSIYTAWRYLLAGSNEANRELSITFHGGFQDLMIPVPNNLPVLKDITGQFKVFVGWAEDEHTIKTKIDARIDRVLSRKTDNIKLTLSGTYYGLNKTFAIEQAIFSSAQLGSISIDGQVKDLSSKSPTYQGRINFHDVSTSYFAQNVLPDQDLLIQGVVNGSALVSVRGSVNRPEIDSLFDIEITKIRMKRGTAESLKLLVPFVYKDKKCTMDRVFIDVQNLAYTDAKGSEYHFGNLWVRLPLIEFAGRLFSGKFTLRAIGGNFTSEDGSIAAERGATSLSGDFQISIPFQTVSLKLQGRLIDLELLGGKFYGRFTNTITFALNGSYNHYFHQFKVLDSELAFKDMGNIHLSGLISAFPKSPSLETAYLSADFVNQKLLDFFVQNNLSSTDLNELVVNGKTRLDLSIRNKSDVYRVKGKLTVADGSLMHKDLAVHGINLELPVNVTFPFSRGVLEQPLFGFFRVSRVAWKNLVIKDLLLLPGLWNNTLMFKDRPQIHVFGGVITLQNPKYTNILSHERALSMSIHLREIDLRHLTNDLGIQRFRGTLSGTVQKAVLTADGLKTKGEIVLDIFNGQVRVRNFSLTNIGDTVKKLRTSITFEDISLGELTRTFQVGQITGVVEGHIYNLVVANGQPEQFRISLQSVPKKGVEQWISVKALKSVSILGSGEPDSILNKGIYQLFKQYRYEKLGLKADLKNDRLKFQGIETEGDKEYLIKGTFLPPKVDVITHVQEISFKDLMKRLMRIKKSE